LSLGSMSALPPKADIRTGLRYAPRKSSGSFAIFAAIRRALSRVSNLLRMVDAVGRKAGIVYLANFPERGAGFGAAGLTTWSMTIRTGGAQ
jgi:hypothetical protein